MVIGIDGNEANVTRPVGVSVYALNLLKYFNKKATAQTQFKVFLRNYPLEHLPLENKFFKYEVVKGAFLWSQIFLPLRLYKKRDINVFFSPAHYLPRYCPVPTVVTIHDLAYLFFEKDFLKKDLFQLKFWTKYSVAKAKKIISVSKTTKNDLVKYYKIPENKISVIYNGFEKSSKSKAEKLKIDTESHPYILYVGTLQPRKNIPTLIAAFDKFHKLHPNFKLVIAGKKGWLYNGIFEKVTDLGLEDEVYFTDYITDNQLIFLYENAFCLVLPSFYEGFGLPVLEAMNYKCPTIISMTSSLPEIGGEASLYIDPEYAHDLVEKLIELKNNSDLRVDMIKKGLEQIKKFSWKDCGDKTLALIKSTIV